MIKPRAFHLELSEHCPHRKSVIAFEVSCSPAIRTATLRSEKVDRLPFDNKLLDVLENGLAFGQSEAECFRLKIISLQGCDLPAFLPTVVGNRNYLNFEFHLRSCPW